MIITFGEYLPDIPVEVNQGLTVASNCIPQATHYESFPSMANYSINTLAQQCKGFVSMKNSTNTVYSYAGDSSALYSLVSGSWASAGATSAYSTAGDDYWEFAVWGDRVLATNYADPVQEITASSSNFHNLAGTPPRARHIAVVKDFVVLGNIVDMSTSGALVNAVHWCGINNVETWSPSAATQADKQQLFGEGGWIQRIVGGEYGIIFRERSIVKMTYVGSPVIFQFDELENGKGTPASNSVVPVGRLIYYLGQDDFYVFNGASSQNIGQNRVYKTFLNDVSPSYFPVIVGVADPTRSIVIWSYASKSSTNGVPNKALVYNYTMNKWSGPVELSVEMLVPFMTPSYTLDQLDAFSTSIDTLPLSFDSRAWTGGNLNLAAFDSNHRLVTFTGADLTATFETGDRQLFPGRRAMVTNVRPVADGSVTCTIAVSGRNRSADTASYGLAVSMNDVGECPVFNENRYQRFRLTVSGDIENITGLDIDAVQGGRY